MIFILLYHSIYSTAIWYSRYTIFRIIAFEYICSKFEVFEQMKKAVLKALELGSAVLDLQFTLLAFQFDALGAQFLALLL